MPDRIEGAGEIDRVSCALIGGAGSTGSSLLRTILNRHPALFSGEELSFFNKEQLFEDWGRYSRRLIPPKWRRPLVTRGWFSYPYSVLQHPDYGWQMTELKPLIRGSRNIRAFATEFFERPLQKAGSRTWIEKTPSNCYSFAHFLCTFPHGKVLHTARHPLDAVASLIRRGMTIYSASSLWLYNTATSLAVQNDSRYLLIRYEDLVSRPEEAVSEVTRFLNVDFLPAILRSKPSDSDHHLSNPGWKHRRTDEISTASVGSFSQLPKREQVLVIGTLRELKVSRSHCISRSLTCTTFEDVCQELDYEIPEEMSSIDLDRLRSSLRRERRRDMLKRTIYSYPTHLLNYPITLRVRSPKPQSPRSRLWKARAIA